MLVCPQVLLLQQNWHYELQQHVHVEGILLVVNMRTECVAKRSKTMSEGLDIDCVLQPLTSERGR